VRLPEFFIVGHQKSGTTALYEMLKRHPQIFMPRLKEPRFLASDLRWDPTARRVPATMDEYLSLFKAARAEQRAGDASPVYLLSHTAAKQIAKLQPAARVIAILREPASFLRSYHLQCVQSRVETQRDLRKALALEGPRREGRELPGAAAWPLELLYSEHVRYVEQLRRFHAVLAPEQVLVLIYDDYRRDNAGTLRTVLRFLEVNETAEIEAVDANPTVHVRFAHLHALLHSLSAPRSPRTRALKSSIKALTPDKLRARALGATRRGALYSEPPPVDQALMRELRARFKPEVVALSDYLGRDLVSLWGYEEVTA
jgi:hypothetical protein